jgi:uncharacterized membrane protein (DUF2068 family)
MNASMTGAAKWHTRAAMAQRPSRGLLLIGAFKLVKAALLMGAGFGIWRLLHGQAAETIEAWIRQLRIDPHNALVHALVERVLGVDRRHLEALDAGTFIYAAVFAAEGVGLLRAKRWAEYLTLGVTVSFIPVEVFEVVEHASPTKAVLTMVNVGIVIYLVRQIRQQRAR